MESETHFFLLEAVINLATTMNEVFFYLLILIFTVSFHFQYRFDESAYFYGIIWLCTDLVLRDYMKCA